MIAAAEATGEAGQELAPPSRPGTFLALCFGQTLAVLGSVLTGFALEVWVYKSTGSVTRFALLSFFTMGPSILLAPLAGVAVDRWNRRRVMIWSDLGIAAGTLGLALLFWRGEPPFAALCLLLAVCSAFSTVQPLALAAVIPQLMPRSQWGRANGMVQFSGALAPLLGPFLGGILLQLIEVRGVILVDIGTVLLAIATLLALRIPEHRREERALSPRGSAREILPGWSYVRERPGLVGLLLLFAALNFTMGMVQTLITPMVLSFASPAVLGSVLSSASFGMLAGGVLMTLWGGPDRRMVSFMLAVFGAQGILLLLGGLRPNVLLITVMGFLYLLCVPVISACSQTLWQSKVPTEIQGRVFSLRQMVARVSLLPAYLLAGPLADFVFEPLLAPGGPLAGSAGRLIGTGPGRGIAFLYMLIGAAVLAGAVLALRAAPLRRLEEELPNVS